jgi:hypothetical protein
MRGISRATGGAVAWRGGVLARQDMPFSEFSDEFHVRYWNRTSRYSVLETPFAKIMKVLILP